jgi:hypothetical protein
VRPHKAEASNNRHDRIFLNRLVQPFAAGAAKGCTAWFMVLMHDLRGTPDSSGSSGPRATLPDKSGVPSRFTVTMRDYRVWRLGGNV